MREDRRRFNDRGLIGASTVVSSRIASAGTARSPISACAGIGLRFQHHRAFLESRPTIGWLEVHPENYFRSGAALQCLERIRADYPISLHGVGLSLGSTAGLDPEHLERLGRLIRCLEPALVSDHLSWSVIDGEYLPDLLPLPMTEEALETVCRNLGHAQDVLQRQLLVENPSSYLRFRHSTIPEAEFLVALAQRSGCRILCDINNLYVSAWNNEIDPHRYLAMLPPELVGEIHLAGHAVQELPNGRALRIDDHGSQVDAAVWTLYEEALDRLGPVPTLIEWDTQVPALDVLLAEAAKADYRLASVHNADRACA